MLCEKLRRFFTEYTIPKKHQVRIRNTRLRLLTFALSLSVAITVALQFAFFHRELCTVEDIGIQGFANLRPLMPLPPNVTQKFQRVAERGDITWKRERLLYIPTFVECLNQTVSTCAGPATLPGFKHMTNNTCTVNGTECKKDTATQQGYLTGTCNRSTETCEIAGWCPSPRNFYDDLNKNNTSHYQTLEWDDYIFLASTSIHFPTFNMWTTYPQTLDELCFYNNTSVNNSHCPAIWLKTIIKMTGADPDIIAQRGGVLNLHVNYDCYLGWKWSPLNFVYDTANCVPNYDFSYIHQPLSEGGMNPFLNGYYFQFEELFDSNRRMFCHGGAIVVNAEVSGKAYFIDIWQAFFVVFNSYLSWIAVPGLMVSLLFGRWWERQLIARGDGGECILEDLTFKEVVVQRVDVSRNGGIDRRRLVAEHA